MKTVWAISLFAIFIILFDSVENKKLQKSFEEIFGDGWHLKEMGEEGEEKEEEANLGEEKEEEANLGEEKEEEAKLAQLMAQENEEKRSGEKQSNQQPMTNENDQNEDEENRENDQQQKREIIRNFYQIKEQIIQRKGELSSGKERSKIERIIAKKLGSNRDQIYKWNGELGMNRKMRTNEERLALMRQYCEMKRKDPKMSGRKIAKTLRINESSIRRWKTQFGGETIFKELKMFMKKQLIVDDERKREIVREFRTIKQKIRQREEKYSKKQWAKIEKLLAKKLGTNRDYVYKWIRELGMTIKKSLFFSYEQKIVIVRAFRAIKEEIKQQKWKVTRKGWNEIERVLAQKLGTNRQYIYIWIKAFGKNQKKMKSNATKLAIMGKYWEMKQNHPKMSDAKIGKALKVSKESIRKWKKRHIK